MMMTRVFAAALLIGGLTLTATAEDRVERHSGGEVRGAIQSMTPEEVTVQTARDGLQSVPVTDISRIRFDGESAEVNLARNAALGGRYADALSAFEGFDPTRFPPARALELQQDRQYFIAYCTAHLALAGEKDPAQAVNLLKQFQQASSRSYHMLPATRLLGDVLASQGNYAEAEAAYQTLTQSKLAGFKAEGLVSRGYALLEQGSTSEAESAFREAAGIVPDNPNIARQVELATLGLATCLAKTGQHDSAKKAVEQLIAQSPEQPELYARAYNVLGQIHNSAGDPKEALLAYLHVDVLYPEVSGQHAEALYYLSQLWKTVGDPARSQAASDMLKQRYAGSSWAKQPAQ